MAETRRSNPRTPLAFFSTFGPVAPFALALVAAACGNSGSDGAATEDAAVDTIQLEDVGDFEEPVFDEDTAFGRVILLKPYDPKGRCFLPPTAVGHPDELPGGGIAPCGKSERCYVRKDGIVFYAAQDCVHGTNFLFNVDDQPYTDLTACEPVKHVESLIKDCPNPTCPLARDVKVDAIRSCATALTSKVCRDATNVPTGCFCDASSPSQVFVTFDGKSSGSVPAGYTACDSSNAACKKALAIADTVQGCPPDAVSDAGGD
ncbi:MAG: hypothetical protein ABI175_30105 [Polyangiales bacterium]